MLFLCPPYSTATLSGYNQSPSIRTNNLNSGAKSLKITFYVFVFVISFIFLMILGYSNSVEVPLDLLVMKGNYSMNLVMAGLLATGFLIGFIGAVLVNRKVQRTKRKAERLGRKEAKQATNNSVLKADETPATSLE